MDSLSFLNLSIPFLMLLKFSATVLQIFSQALYLRFLLQVNIGVVNVVPKVSETTLIFFSFFFIYSVLWQ